MKSIPGYEGVYSITKTGKIYSHPRYNFKKGRWINPYVAAHGYLRISLSVNGKEVRKFVHRLVAETFLENPENKNEVNHKDGNKTNNAVKNLEWCTRKENCYHAAKNNLSKRKLTKEDADEVRLLKGIGLKPIFLAKVYNVSSSVVQSIVRNKTYLY